MIRYYVEYYTPYMNVDVPVKSASDANRIAFVLIASGMSNVAIRKAYRRVTGDDIAIPGYITDPVDDGGCDPLYGTRMDDADLRRN